MSDVAIRHSLDQSKIAQPDTVAAYDHSSRSMQNYPIRPTLVQKLKEQTMDPRTAEEVERARAQANPTGD